MIRNGFQNLLKLTQKHAARWRFLLSAVAVLAICLTARFYWGARKSLAQMPTTAAPTEASAPTSAQPNPSSPDAQPLIPPHKPIPDIVAIVNGQQVTRDELAQECRSLYGKDVLEAMVNKALILQECRQRNISVSRADVEHEIETMAKSFNMSVDQWLHLLKEDRHIRPEQYAEDVIWPSLALKALAGNSLKPTPEQFKAAFETEYGPTIKARVIICASLKKAKEVQAMAVAAPANFGELAKKYSEDTPSACVKGLIQPIRMHGPCPEVEQVAFAMKDGQISDVIPSAGQYVIVLREKQVDGPRIADPEAVQKRITKIIVERNLRNVASNIFKDLQKRAQVQNIFNDPQQRMIYGAGVVALINRAPIYLRQLDEECMTRHGTEVLDSLVNRRLIEYACRSQHITITEAEIEAEVARAAVEMMKPLPSGAPDIKGWLAVVAKNQGISADIYRRNAIWPAVALRKLAAGNVEVTQDDITKAFDANYGPRVKCRAIVFNNQRRAQEIWDKARQGPNGKGPTADHFGELASKYSVEGSSRALAGEVPPIRRNGGQPDLETEAFKLKAGDLSGVIQLDGDKWVVLFCEGYTEPISFDPASVQNVLIADIREKKQRLAMAQYFAKLQDDSTISNFVDPNGSRSPRKEANTTSGLPSAVVPASYVPPGTPVQYGR